MFYVFEGIDGSGKTTQARRLKEHLEQQPGRKIIEVREPGGTPLGEQVRDVLLDPRSGDLTPEVEVLLFMAARAHLCVKRIRPALEEGAIVIADRFVWSSVVYQGIAGGLGPDAVIQLGKMATRGLEPTRTFLIDLEPEIAYPRISTRDRMESRGVDFQRRVREGYLSLAGRYPGQFSTVDGSGSSEEVHARVLEALDAGSISRSQEFLDSP